MSIKGLAKRINAIQRRLDNSSTPTARPGATRNMWGTYWDTGAVEEMIAVHASALTEITEPNERHALAYRNAGFLLAALRLDQAIAACDRMIATRPDKLAPAMRLKSEALARNGLLEEALALSRQLEADEGARWFRISADDLAAMARAADST